MTEETLTLTMPLQLVQDISALLGNMPARESATPMLAFNQIANAAIQAKAAAAEKPAPAKKG